MNPTRYLVGLVTFVWILAVAAEPPDERWQVVSNEAFSFSIPTTLKKTDLHGTDAFFEVYRGNGIDLHVYYGTHTHGFPDWPKEATYEEIQVNGVSARIGTVQRTPRDSPDKYFITEIYFEETKHPAVKLAISATCRTEKEVQLAKKIFQTIRVAGKSTK